MDRPESELPSLARWARDLADGVYRAVASVTSQFGSDISDSASDVWQAAARKTSGFACWRLVATLVIAKFVPKMPLNGESR
jgi:hypothetical protein